MLAPRARSPRRSRGRTACSARAVGDRVDRAPGSAARGRRPRRAAAARSTAARLPPARVAARSRAGPGSPPSSAACAASQRVAASASSTAAGKRVLGRQPVVDARHDRARRVRQRAAERVEAVEVPDRPAAAVEVGEQRRAAPRPPAGRRAPGSRRRARAARGRAPRRRARPAPLSTLGLAHVRGARLRDRHEVRRRPGAAFIRSTSGWISSSSTRASVAWPGASEAAPLACAHDRRVALAPAPGERRVDDPQRRTGRRRAA